MPTNIMLHGMTGMRQKWDEWHWNDGMRRSLRQPNRHLIQLILMSFVSFRHHPKAVYNGDDSLMTPKWGPRQDRSGQLSLFGYIHHDENLIVWNCNVPQWLQTLKPNDMVTQCSSWTMLVWWTSKITGGGVKMKHRHYQQQPLPFSPFVIWS